MCSPASPFAFSSLAILRRLMSMIGDELRGGGGIEPSPTILRRVSGWNLRSAPLWHTLNTKAQVDTYKTRGIKTTAVAMVKNQKMDLQPNVELSTPPNNGPKAGPVIAPAWNTAKNLPRSRGSAISEIDPAPIEITADPPVA